MHLMPLKPNSQRKRGADASLAAHLFMREDSSCTCSQINLRVFLLLLSTTTRREERDRSTGVALVFLSRDLRLCRTPSSQPTLPPAKAPVIWIFLFNEGDFKREGGLSWSRERRKALSAGSPTMFGPFFTTTEQCQAPPHNCSACVLTRSLGGKHFANARYLLFLV